MSAARPLWISNRTREAELRRMPLAVDQPSLFDRHPFACALAVMVALAVGCLALVGVFP